MTQWLLKALFIWIAMFMLTFVLPLQLLPQISIFCQSPIIALNTFIGEHLFGLQNFTPKVLSDSTGMYIHCFNLTILSLVLSLIWQYLTNRKRLPKVNSYWLSTMCTYYLSFNLLVYGLIKLFKWQFYLPEPNLLYTEMGDIPKDMLYWSVMGVSKGYVMALGLIEILIAGLLLFRRTRLIGGLGAIAAMVNIVLVNFGFDIDVKLYACILLLMACISLLPYFRKFYTLFIQQKPTDLKAKMPNFFRNVRHRNIYLTLKIIIIGLFLTEGLYPYISTGNYNDDIAPRPKFHGAYQVKHFMVNGKSLPADEAITQRWKKIFIHRMGYFIVQNMANETSDYSLKLDINAHLFELEDYTTQETFRFRYLDHQDTLQNLYGIINKDTFSIQLKALNWRKKILLSNEFNWTFDQLLD